MANRTVPTNIPVSGMNPAAPTRPSFAATQTAVANEATYVLERVTLATNVDENSVPQEEVSVIPSASRSVFLAVLASEIEPQTQFRAFWYEGDTLIGRSEVIVTQSEGEQRWIALGLQVGEDLQPSQSHTVELWINERVINTYSFRVGVGDLEDAVAEATMALGTNSEGEPVGPGEEFDTQAPQVVAVVRMSTVVNPTGMIFSASLYRDGVLVEQRGPDGGQPVLPAEPQLSDRQVTFTYVPDNTFPVGEYDVVVLINGQETVTLPFDVISQPEPTATLPGAANATSTPTLGPSGVSIINTAVTFELDPEDGSPAGDRIEYWAGEPDQLQVFYVSVRLADLRLDDVIEVDALLDGRHVNRHTYPIAAFNRGWLAIPINVWAPPAGEDSKEYTFNFYINGTRSRSIELTAALLEE